MELAQIGEIVAVAGTATGTAAGSIHFLSLGAYMKIRCALSHLTPLSSCVRAPVFLGLHLV